MATKRNITYKCPFCDRRYNRDSLVRHVGNKHSDMLPEGFTPLRYVFNYVNKKGLDYHGKCTECGGPTPWDENKGRYDRQCGKKACHDSYVRKFEANMIRTKGYKRISQTTEGQEKMLARRKISGEYTFADGGTKTYVGSYEKNTLEFMDKVMHIKSSDVMTPGPTMEYTYKGQKHVYISDIYYQPYNLVIEVKDGGSNPNKRNMPEYRGKQIAKENYIIKNTNFNYLRLTDNDFSQLLSVFMDLKMQLIDNTGERVVHVNEAMSALMGANPVGITGNPNNVYIVNYMQNNVFSGYDDRKQGYAISDSPKFTNLVTRNAEGILAKVNDPFKFLEHCRYNVYKISNPDPEIMNMISKEIGNFVEEGFIYETIFGKKLYSYDQIVCEDAAIPVLDYYQFMNYYSKITENYLLGLDKDSNYVESCIKIPEWMDEERFNFKINLLEGKSMIQSKAHPEFVIVEDYTDIDKYQNEYLVLNSIIGGNR